MKLLNILILPIVFTACTSSINESNEEVQASHDFSPRAVQMAYADLALISYTKAYESSEILNEKIKQFAKDPTVAENYESIKQAWLNAREAYGQTEAFRFSNGPIDNKSGLEAYINAWPIDESYLDYTIDDPNSGLINNPSNFPEFTEENLMALNESGGEENVSLGFHAIEFLLWGQDLSATDSLQSGTRTFLDYVENSTRKNAKRRLYYLLSCSDILMKHLKTVAAEWKLNQASNFRAQFEARSPEIVFNEILDGLAIFSKAELAGERIYTAYDNRDQEDEHSCFSDNTHRDIYLNLLGIDNILNSRYELNNKVLFQRGSLMDLIAKRDGKTADEIKSLLEKSFEQCASMGSPFDDAINNEEKRPQILELVKTLRRLGDMITVVKPIIVG